MQTLFPLWWITGVSAWKQTKTHHSWSCMTRSCLGFCYWLSWRFSVFNQWEVLRQPDLFQSGCLWYRTSHCFEFRLMNVFSVFCKCALIKLCWSCRSRPWRVSWALCGICRLTASTTRWRSVRWTELWASWSARWRTDVRPTHSPSSRAAEGSFETCRVWSPREKTTGECLRLQHSPTHVYKENVLLFRTHFNSLNCK